MTDICSNIDQAGAIAKRLIRHNQDVSRARAKRDICLYKYLEEHIRARRTFAKHAAS